MHLTELAISNFRCIRHLEIKPTPGINLILGPNGAGKTSILESIFFYPGDALFERIIWLN